MDAVVWWQSSDEATASSSCLFADLRAVTVPRYWQRSNYEEVVLKRRG
jgi:hypothetical protein